MASDRNRRSSSVKGSMITIGRQMDRRDFLARMLASGSFLLLEGACGSDGGAAAPSAVAVSTSLATITTRDATSSAATTTASANPFPALPERVWDQGMGITDASGLVTGFPFRAAGTAVQIWVNTATGNDSSYNGKSPYPGFRLNGTGPYNQYNATGPGVADSAYGPKASFGALRSTTPLPSVPDQYQFFFAEGQTFTVDFLFTAGWCGYSAQYPTCFQSYDPADPLNISKHGRAGTGQQGARPIWTSGTAPFPTGQRGDARDYGNYAFRGINCISTGNCQYFNYVYSQNNMLFENMILNNVQIILDNSNPNIGFTTNSNNIIRRCVSFGQYDTGSVHVCGVHSSNTNLTIEDSVWWHCGWKVGASRDDAVSAGGPDIFKHCLYIANGNGTTATVRRNVCIDGSAAGMSFRANYLAHHNVIIDCPTPEFSSAGGPGGGGDSTGQGSALHRSYSQLVIGGADVNTTTPRGLGYSSSGSTIDSFCNYCLYINNSKMGIGPNNWLAVSTNSTAPITSYANFTGNRAYAFALPSKRIFYDVVSPGTLPQINVLTDVDNVLSTSSPMTNAQIYTALGYANKDTAVSAMVSNPMEDWAYRILSIAGTGFSFDFNKTI